MKKIYLLITIGVFLLSCFSNAQTNTPKLPENVQLPIEKVYLHCDRQYYTNNDDIWFKAYLVDAVTNKPSEISNNLYVELISPDLAIVKRITIRIDNGLGIGDFHLGDSIPSGNYQLRAYTNWMCNFGELFVFKKGIKIENFNGTKLTNKIEETKEVVDIQFFPESGSLIENVNEVIAFKAVTSQSNGCKVHGKIVSSSGDTVASFESNHLGMGSCNFISKPGFTYTANGVSNNGISFTKSLPQALKTGYALRVTETDNENIWVTVKTNQDMLNRFQGQELLLVGTSHGKLCVTAKIKVRAMVNNLAIPKSGFPEGIARFTLVDSTRRPHCERLFYVSKNKQLSLSVIPVKRVTANRQQVTLNISAKDIDGNPVTAFLSLAAVNKDQSNGPSRKSDILSYLQLESELKGVIEQPTYYFETSSPERLKALDNLLLTQGWRDFIWKNLSDTTINISYLLEKGISVSGRLRRLMVNKPIIDANISMGLFGGPKPSLYFTKTDSTGKYYFDGLNFTGQRNIVVSATNKKSRSQGLILLDSIFSVPVKPSYFSVSKTEFQKFEEIQYFEEADRKYNILKKYHLTDTIQLNAVTVKGNKKSKVNEDDHFRIYGIADVSITVTDDMLSYNNIFTMLEGRVPGLRIAGHYPDITVSIRGSAGYPLFLVDGMPVDIEEISSIPIPDIDKIEVLKDIGSIAMFGSQGGNGVISILMKKVRVGNAKPVFYTINRAMYGYYQSRTFYMPKYDSKPVTAEKPDLRSTVHWEPNIKTDANGKASVIYYNGDDKVIVDVQVEGISAAGIPLVGSSNYEVK